MKTVIQRKVAPSLTNHPKSRKDNEWVWAVIHEGRVIIQDVADSLRSATAAANAAIAVARKNILKRE